MVSLRVERWHVDDYKGTRTDGNILGFPGNRNLVISVLYAFHAYHSNEGVPSGMAVCYHSIGLTMEKGAQNETTSMVSADDADGVERPGA